MDRPTTLSELHEMLYQFVNGDPTGTGERVHGYTSNGGLGPINAMVHSNFGFDASGWVYDQDQGRWIQNFMSPRIVEPIQYLQNLYMEGLIDPEMSENTFSQALQKFAMGAFGAVGRNADTFWINQTITVFYGGANPDIDPLDEVDLIHMLRHDDYPTPRINMTLSYGGNMISSQTTDEQVERYVMIHDWILSDEGTTMLHLGFEGEHYLRDASGALIPLDDPATGEPFNINLLSQASRIRLQAGWFMDLEMDPNWPTAGIPTEIKLFSRERMDERDQFTLMHDPRLQLITTPALDRFAINWGDNTLQMVVSDEDVSVAVSRFQDQFRGMGVEQVITEANEAFEALGIEIPARFLR
jgi:putative aldouronate transport system substrate-binding protein